MDTKLLSPEAQETLARLRRSQEHNREVIVYYGSTHATWGRYTGPARLFNVLGISAEDGAALARAANELVATGLVRHYNTNSYGYVTVELERATPPVSAPIAVCATPSHVN